MTRICTNIISIFSENIQMCWKPRKSARSLDTHCQWLIDGAAMESWSTLWSDREIWFPRYILLTFSVHFNLGRFAEKASGISALLRTTDAGSILLFKVRLNEIRKSSPDGIALPLIIMSYVLVQSLFFYSATLKDEVNYTDFWDFICVSNLYSFYQFLERRS